MEKCIYNIDTGEILFGDSWIDLWKEVSNQFPLCGRWRFAFTAELEGK